jgi:hypothetical protein
LSEFAGLPDDAVRALLSAEHPVVFRGLIGHWAAVEQARVSPEALIRYFQKFDRGGLVDALLTPPQFDGELSYNAAMTGFNFVRNRLPVSALAEQLLRYSKFPNPPSLAAQSALIHDCLPGFDTENVLRVLPPDVAPRIWLGNRVVTPAHVDEWNNIGCVVAGRRRFTLFPPDQIGNLYIGPLDFAPTGAAMSLVSLKNPDFERYPKFREALAAAHVAELGAGDALYIPPLWWHHVESLEPFNVLVNYWWHADAGQTPLRGGEADSAFDALLLGILSIRSLPPATRRAWAALFEHYVFAAHEVSVSHIPAERRGILDKLSPAQAAALREHLVRKLTQRRGG